MPILIFFSAFIFYLYNLAPSITVGDSGEFCASSVVLGVCHSPGYPLFSLLGKFFTTILPFASYAFRVNVMTAFFASLSLVILYLIVCHILNDAGLETTAFKTAAFLCVLFLGLSGDYHAASIQTEVFTLNTFFAVLVIAAYVWEKPYLMAFIYGFGLGNHHTLVFLGPLMVFAVLRHRMFKLKQLALLCLLFACGFSVYAYLPIRAFKAPPFNWGNVTSLNNFWRVITRADYGSLSLSIGEKLPRTAYNSYLHLKAMFGEMARQFGVLGVALGCAGWLYALKNRKKYSAELLVLWLLAGPGFLLLANMPFDAQSVGIMGRFYILVNMFWVFGIMWGLEIVVRAAGRPWAARLVLKLAAVLVIFAAWSSPMHYSWRDYYLEYDYGRNLLKTLPHGSTLFMDGGDDTFYSTGYLTFAQGLRPDVELHDRGGLVFKSIYGEDFRRLEKKAKESRRLTCEYGYLARGKKIYYSTFDENVLPGVGVVADGILLRPKAYGKSDAWDSYSLRSVYGKDYDDYRSRALVPLYPYFEAVHSNDRDYLVYDLKKWSDVVWMPGNIKFKFLRSAYDSFSAGKLDEAEGTYRLTLKYFPQETSAMLNLGVIEEKRNNLAGALELYNQAISVEPSNLDAYYNLSVIYWKQSRWDKAADCYRKMLAINPGDARANQYLAVVMKKIGGK